MSDLEYSLLDHFRFIMRVTNMIFNGSAQLMTQEVQVISRVKLFFPSFAMFLPQ